MPKATGAGSPPTNPTLDAALAWAEKGFPVFPLAHAEKIPAIPDVHKGEKARSGQPKCKGECGRLGHGVRDASRDPEKIRRMFESRPKANIGGSTLDRLVVDLDLNHGGVEVDELPPTRVHESGRGNGNTHRIYRLGTSNLARLAKSAPLAAGVDLRTGPGAYIVLPPSIHPESRQPYKVLEDLPEHALTNEDVRAIWGAYGAKLPGEGPDVPAAGAPLPSGERSYLVGGLGQSEAVQFILNPPTRGRGVTNDALSKVAGYYARLYRESRELFDYHVLEWIRKVDPDYEDTGKTLESIWNSEQSKTDGAPAGGKWRG